MTFKFDFQILTSVNIEMEIAVNYVSINLDTSSVDVRKDIIYNQTSKLAQVKATGIILL